VKKGRRSEPLAAVSKSIRPVSREWKAAPPQRREKEIPLLKAIVTVLDPLTRRPFVSDFGAAWPIKRMGQRRRWVNVSLTRDDGRWRSDLFGIRIAGSGDNSLFSKMLVLHNTEDIVSER
jgi:hypothetical protein